MCRSNWVIAVAPRSCPDCPKQAEALEFRKGRWTSRFYLPGEACANELQEAGAPKQIVQAWPTCGDITDEGAAPTLEAVAQRWYKAIRAGDQSTASQYEAPGFRSQPLTGQALNRPFTCTDRAAEGSCLPGWAGRR